MAKTFRFTELVKKAGHPQVATLWTDPKSDGEFSKAIRENRVLTILGQNAGTKKEFGKVGFLKKKDAAYFVFPKSLPQLGKTWVVGIKYDLLAQRKISDPVKPERTLSKKESARRIKKETEREYHGILKRTAVWEEMISVRAKNQIEADEKLQQQAKSKNLPLSEAVIENVIRKTDADKTPR